MELTPRTLGATDYGTRTPLDDVIRILKECKGAVVLGYPQITFDNGTVRGVVVNTQTQLPTEWNHIEAALAYAEKLPLLVVGHVGVTRGVFDRGALPNFLFAKDLTLEAWSADDDITGALRTWRDEVLGFKPTPLGPRAAVLRAIEAEKATTIWTVRGIGRRIGDPQPLGDAYREGAECRVEEVNEFYVRLLNISSGMLYTVPAGDITISRDEKQHRPMIEVRRQGL